MLENLDFRTILLLLFLTGDGFDGDNEILPLLLLLMLLGGDGNSKWFNLLKSPGGSCLPAKAGDGNLDHTTLLLLLCLLGKDGMGEDLDFTTLLPLFLLLGSEEGIDGNLDITTLLFLFLFLDGDGLGSLFGGGILPLVLLLFLFGGDFGDLLPFSR